MLLVKTKLAPSKINGIGLFADEFIPKGKIIWQFKTGFDIKKTKAELESLSEPSKNQWLKYAYLNPVNNKYILCFDDARFFNHSENPNIGNAEQKKDGEMADISLSDIQIGEELTCNYKTFDADYSYKMRLN